DILLSTAKVWEPPTALARIAAHKNRFDTAILAIVFAPVSPTSYRSFFAQRSERRPQLLGEELRLFPGGKVPPFVELVVIDELGICPLRPAPRRRDDVVRKNAYRNRYGDVLG